MALRSVAEGATEGVGQQRGCFDRATVLLGTRASCYGIASSFGRHCLALRGCIIRVVAFRAFHPASRAVFAKTCSGIP
jgi:hypothetical protein